MTDRNARRTSLVLMLKAPDRSKRRLAAALGEEAGAEAARRLAACALEDLAAWPGPTWLAPADYADLDWLGDGHAAARHAVVLQGDGNLGARIARVADTLRAQGFGTQMFVGIDCPSLDAAYLERAAGALEDHDVVLGPASDGGVVLMGTRRGWPALEPLPWSTDRLGAALDEACRRAGSSVAALEPRHDIDNFADLTGLRRSLEHDGRPARRALREWLERVTAGRKGSA